MPPWMIRGIGGFFAYGHPRPRRGVQPRKPAGGPEDRARAAAARASGGAVARPRWSRSTRPRRPRRGLARSTTRRRRRKGERVTRPRARPREGCAGGRIQEGSRGVPSSRLGGPHGIHGRDIRRGGRPHRCPTGHPCRLRVVPRRRAACRAVARPGRRACPSGKGAWTRFPDLRRGRRSERGPEPASDPGVRGSALGVEAPGGPGGEARPAGHGAGPPAVPLRPSVARQVHGSQCPGASATSPDGAGVP